MGDININLSPKVPSIPRTNDKTKIDVRYSVIAPFVSIHIYYDPAYGEVIYEVEEPILSDMDKSNFEKIEMAMREIVNVSLLSGERTPENLIEYVDKTAKLIISELGLSVNSDSYKKIFYYLYRNFVGFNDTDKLAGFVEKLAQKTGRHISYASPILDGSLPDGSRVNATYTQDITSKGPTFTIRKFTKVPWTPIQLIGFRSLSPEMLAYFWILLQYKSNMLIVGGTASGKTTLLNAIAFFIPQESRVVSIEDTRELNLPRENWLPSVVRTGLREDGGGGVEMFSLLRSSFRQNPDYVIVGEVRGKEASVLFQGMASGHASISTMHADSVESVVRRLETPPISLSPSLINGMDAVIVMSHAIVDKHETRRLREIVEVINVKEDGSTITNTPFQWNPADDGFYSAQGSSIFEKISKKYGISLEEIHREYLFRAKLLYAMYQRKVLGYDEVQKVINDYAKNPQEVLSRFGIS